jgi:hypothetical protein
MVEAKILVAGRLNQRGCAQLVTGIERTDLIRLAYLHDQVERELAPDHGSNIKRALRRLAQAIDA